MKKVLKGVWNVLQIIIVVYVILMTVLFLNKNKYGYTQIGSRSFISIDEKIKDNLDGYKKGDLAIIQKVDQINDGDTVYYYFIGEDEYYIGSDKVELNGNKVVIDKKTLGNERIIGTKVTKISLLGNFLLLIETKLGFLLFVLLPILIVFAYQVYEFIVDTKKEKEEVINSEYGIIDDEII